MSRAAYFPVAQPVTRDSDYPINRQTPPATFTAENKFDKVPEPQLKKPPSIVFFVVIALLAVGGVYLVMRVRR